ncbi:protein FAR1-RELATED SEQUENCE 5-like [Oryza glaberrima]|uniref:protein FAR1-RELATED SEQUENCE 5-like n=1 Tax=Oryza glaberrima TaxID=4538 RepID=UPI00224C2D9D|nr:protein FAR1-RELATED SEQUENCE 5-like [Oryza glaberrima]
MDTANRSREPKALTRCGCNARFEIKLDKKKGDWFVVKYVARHNHPLAKLDEVAFLQSHRTISNAQKANILELKEVGLRQHQVMDVMERHHGGFDATYFVSRDLYNYFTRLRKKHILGGDVERVIKYFQLRQKDDMEFFFEYETDEAGRLKRYNLPFILFVGVNHHGSTKHPGGLITDGDNAMRRAIAAVMPDSEHRLCTWHIEQNMARHLRPDMLSDFRALVHAPYNHEEFDRKWVEFKVKHKGCEDNQWLVRMYNLRKKWVTVYTKEHYEHCLSRMRYRKAELDCKASKSIPFTSNDASLIEKDAARIFTPAVFKKLKLVVVKSMDWEVIDCIEEDNLVKYVISMKGDSKMELQQKDYEDSWRSALGVVVIVVVMGTLFEPVQFS